MNNSWDLKKDYITRKIGRKSEINKWELEQEIKLKKAKKTKKAR